MSMLKVEASQIITAPADHIYNILRDYEVGHQAILPQKYFKEMRVIKGGQGAGTEIYLRMEVMGQTHELKQIVSEPEVGRVLLESNIENDDHTRFIVEPLNDAQTRVTIASEFGMPAGLAGHFQRLIQPMVMRPIYREELEILAQYATELRPAEAS